MRCFGFRQIYLYKTVAFQRCNFREIFSEQRDETVTNHYLFTAIHYNLLYFEILIALLIIFPFFFQAIDSIRMLNEKYLGLLQEKDVLMKHRMELLSHFLFLAKGMLKIFTNYIVDFFIIIQLQKSRQTAELMNHPSLKQVTM